MRAWQSSTLIIGRCLAVVLLSLSLTSVAGLMYTRAHGERLLSVQTGSMEPVLYPGDAVLIEKTSGQHLRSGEIITYQSPRAPGLTITHRLVNIDSHSGWLTTEGDALDSPDPAFPPRQVIGQVTAVLPRLGVVLDGLRRPIVLVVVLYAPGGTIIFAEVRRLASVNSSKFYSLRNGR